ncbi:efflux RND transporter periplasmic adaptor subunit [Kitasatospora purpeofusca]|uniref:efflux RND transporter periplasmic adaptor subunit n=1 Tax=Kitasatospora purpeofusca TaxID=67352 RepID=UPI0022532B26|nr:biotin/lipoyl-binding protein [Kitasatospora purpeofusca]MCX4753948.1 biotin/lipoyl-binding protein [Kitasatospora purpeofusca]WSR33412.1 biotin/lipoyl-binding protein [Kitasatospora purpeofusca]
MKVFPRRRGAVLVNSALGVALLGAAALAYTVLDDGSGTTAAKAPVRTATVTKGTVLATVSGTGTLASPTDAAQDFTTGGRLTAVKVAVGDQVTKGQVLATVDTTAAQQQVDAAQAALNTASVNLTKARAGVTTTTVQQLPARANGSSGSSGASGGGGTSGGASGANTGGTAGRGAGGSSASAPSADPSGQTAPSAQATVPAAPVAVPEPQTTTISTTKVDEAAVAQAEQQLATAQTNLSNARTALAGTTLTASVDGTVASVAARAGDTVGATGGSSSGSGTKATGSSATAPSGFIVLTNPTGMQVTANFSELDSLKLKKGEAATVTLNAQSDSRFNASVLSVSPLPVSGSGGGAAAVQYSATLQISGDTSKLRTGLSATVSVVTGEADNALSLPTSALSGTGSSRTATVVHQDGSSDRVTVEVGVEGDTTVQVLTGLNEGDKVELASTSGSNGFPNGSFPGATGGQGGRNGGAGAGVGAGVAGVGGGGAAGGAGAARGGGGR